MNSIAAGCPSRFIIQRLTDPDQDRRMECAKTLDHKGWHRNETGDLRWQSGAEVDLSGILVVVAKDSLEPYEAEIVIKA